MRSFVKSQKDSTSVTITERLVFRDSIVFVEVPQEKEAATLSRTDTSHLETSLAISDAWMEGDKLRHTLLHKSLSLEKLVNIPMYIKERSEATISAQVVVKEVERELSGWQKFQQTLGLISLGAIGLAIVLLIIRIIRKFTI